MLIWHSSTKGAVIYHFSSLPNTKMDVSKLSISCLAKRYRLVRRNVESRPGKGGEGRRAHGASERFHCRGTSNRGIMGIVCCWISIQAASSQQQSRTSHFFRAENSAPFLFFRVLLLALAYWIHLQWAEFRKAFESGPDCPDRWSWNVPYSRG